MQKAIQVVCALTLAVVAIKLAFILLGLLGFAIGLVAFFVKMAIVGGLLYVGFVVLRNLLNHRETSL